MPDEQKPTVGRIVHYTPPQDCKGKTTLDFYAAMITQVHNGLGEIPDMVDLVTFGPNSIYFQHQVLEAIEPTPGSWNWPPREGKT